MSINTAIDQSHLAEVEALSELLESYLQRRASSSTKEGQLLVESEAVDLFQRLVDLDHSVNSITPGDFPEFTEFQQEYGMYFHLVKVNAAKLRRLTQLFISHFNSQQFALTELVGRLKRIRQKKAALALWSGEDAKFVLSNHFLNFDTLDSKFTSSDACFVDTTQGVLTLPIRDNVSLPVKTVSIGSGSNGSPGNSDVAVTTNNLDPGLTTNGDSNTWFEYERLDSGPLELTLVIVLSKADIVNNISIAPLNLGLSYTYSVEDISFSNTGRETVGLSDLFNSTDRDQLVVKSAGNDSEWSLTFLPVVAKTITIKLKQVSSHDIFVATSNGGTARRRRYAIGISRIGVNQIKYETAGGINSTELPVPGGLYLTIPVVDIWPPKPELFDAFMEVSFDGGGSWVSAENVDDSVGGSVVMSGEESSMMWRIQLERDGAALDNSTSFVPDVSATKEISTLLRAVPKGKSPATYSLSDRPARDEVFVVQPKVARRGNRLKRVLIGVGSGAATNFTLPFSPVNSGIDPESMHIYVNGFKYTYVENNSSLAPEQWSFSDDFNEIELSGDLSERSRVEAVFDEERMFFEERSDGYYHQMELLFDPDEDNIGISYLPRVGARSNLLLPRDLRIIRLGVTNIETDTFVLSSSSGISYVSVSDRTTLSSTPNGYMLDSINGILWLNSAFDSDTVRASFSHQSSSSLSSDGFDVVYESDSVRPWGIRVSPDHFQAKTSSDTVGGSLLNRINPITGAQEARSVRVTSSSLDAMSLSDDYIVKGSLVVGSDLFDRTYVSDVPQELDFVDGRTEFLGLVSMDSESTVSTTLSPLESTVVFNLAAGSLLYRDFPVLFGNTAVFSTDTGSSTPSSIGEYSISESGSVSVYVGSAGTLPGGIGINYYYQDPEFEPQNKYSVDYKKGVLYGGSDLQTGTVVSYKSSTYKIAYNVAREIDRFQYNSSSNSVDVWAEDLGRINSLIKIIWAKQTQQQSLREFRDYFSPILSTLSFRFN